MKQKLWSLSDVTGGRVDPIDLATFREYLGIRSDNEQAEVDLRELEAIWMKWPDFLRWRLVNIVQSLVATQAAKVEWKPTNELVVARYRSLADIGIQAARLASLLAATFPPPWHGDTSQVGDLASRLGQLARWVRDSAQGVDLDFAIPYAHKTIKALRRESKNLAGTAIWYSLLARLVQLAEGSDNLLDSNTIRDYGGRKKQRPTPAARRLARHQRDLEAAISLAPPVRELSTPIERVFSEYLDGSLKADRADVSRTRQPHATRSERLRQSKTKRSGR